MGVGPLLARALQAREALRCRLAAEGTDCWRWLHGTAEGRPGLAVDVYGSLVLAQTFREPLAAGELEAIGESARGLLGAGTHVVWNDRAKAGGGSVHLPAAPELAEHEVREQGDRFVVRARHRGADPWLFLDLRAGRRALRAAAAGRSVLNLFAYTATAGVAAAVAGAAEVWNVDFARSSLAVGELNAARNGVGDRMRFVCEDFHPVVWQLAGLGVHGRRARRGFARLGARHFDIVFLDPPAWSRGAFGAVDVVRDYQGLFKPALLCARPGGLVICTNHRAEVTRASFAVLLERCAEKARVPLAALELAGPDEDFPSPDEPPLKIALCTLAG
jgi:23S rRNA (cytosine1962-C5)-methyltransferase